MHLIKYILKSTLYIGVLFLFFSCDNDDSSSNLIEPTPTLNGTYILTTINADVPVDLNNDDITNTNLLEETSCFDIMEVNFNTDGSFSAINSKLDFNGGASGNEVTCTTRTDSGTWSLTENELTLSVIIAGTTITETKEILLTGEYANKIKIERGIGNAFDVLYFTDSLNNEVNHIDNRIITMD
uniref:DUF5004 domain-containing protein n=1 Tax=Croceibacter atlanticus TaxID=313588 RepID=UPI0024908FBE